jgi:hypothetical protein
MGGIFSGMVDTGYNLTAGRKVNKREYSIQRQRLGSAMDQLQRGMAFRRDIEDPRERAMLNQGMYARGLGKSSISEQDKARLGTIQSNRLTQMNEQFDILRRTRSLMKRKRRYGRYKLYADVVADVLDTALAVYTGGMTGVSDPSTAGEASRGGSSMMGMGDIGGNFG